MNCSHLFLLIHEILLTLRTHYLSAQAEKGDFELRPAFGYSGQKGSTSAGPMKFQHVNQQAKQMDGIAMAIRNNHPTPVSGEMGRRDVKIIQAVYEAMRTGGKVKINDRS